jgi:hypothetical protein
MKFDLWMTLQSSDNVRGLDIWTRSSKKIQRNYARKTYIPPKTREKRENTITEGGVKKSEVFWKYEF